MKKTKKKMKTRKPIQAYAFIDTNIFLDFYRVSNEATLKLLKKLDKVRDRIICTYQVEMEFLKNRQDVILNTIKDSHLDFDASLPAVLGDSNIDNSLKKAKKDLKNRRKKIDARVSKILENPISSDPIYSTLENIFNSNSKHVLTRDMKIRHKIKRLAWRRFMLGYPPRKVSDTSIGDALNWEWFVHICNELTGKFIIVSRDADYGAVHSGHYYLNDALKSEFRDRAGKKSIKYTRKLSDALKLLDINVTQTEEESEDQQIETLNEITIKLGNTFQGIQIPDSMKRALMIQKKIGEKLKSMHIAIDNQKAIEAILQAQDIVKKLK